MDNQRQRIKAIDRLLVRVLKERVEIGKELAQIKRDQEVDIEDSAQEDKVIRRACEYAEQQISDDCSEEVEDVWRAIIELTKSEMKQ